MKDEDDTGRMSEDHHTLLHSSRSHPRPLRGLLRLQFERVHEAKRTVLASSEHLPPLKVVRAFSLPDGGALVHLHNLSGGVLGGDHLKLNVNIGRDATAQLTSTGATRLYRSLKGVATSVQVNEIKVGENALLEYLPDALIPFKGARYDQETQIDLAEGAGLFWWEMVAPGRAARGEIFVYDLLQFKLDIRAAGIALVQERLKLEPVARPLSSLVRLGPYRYFSTFYICRVGVDAAFWLALEKELMELAQRLSVASEILWGVSTLPRHGLAIRALSTRGGPVVSGLLVFWRAAKLRLYGRDATRPRKVT
jgi:urease accessory protein